MERLRRAESFGCSHDLISALVREPSVAFVAAESEAGGVWVENGMGAARVLAHGKQITYQPVSGDPLLLHHARSATSREWLEATWDAAFPDASYHLLDQFRSQRSGDLLVIGQEGYDFRARFELPEHRWGHGSLTRAHMQIPVWSSQPVPPAPLRTVDLFPALLNWLGAETPEGIDGEPVWLPGRRPPSRRPARQVTAALP
jgi:hypothetical protein